MSSRTLSLTKASGSNVSQLIRPDGSVLFGGSTSVGFITVADNAALQMGSGDFTWEWWWYPTSLTGYQTPIDKGYTGTGGLLFQTGNGDGKLIVYASGSAAFTSTTAVTVNNWKHIALVRSGTTLTLYQGGVSVGSATNSTNFNATDQLVIGANGLKTGSATLGQYPIVGNISNLRIVKGTAVYTAAFTPPTRQLSAIPKTSLLTCQHSDRIIDRSLNNFAIGFASASTVPAAKTTQPF